MYFEKLLKTLEELLGNKTHTVYRCQGCNGFVAKDTKQCPHCGVWLAYIECTNCGFRGQEEHFIDDICPECGDLIKQQAQGCLPLVLNFFKRDTRIAEEKRKDRELERLFGTNTLASEERRRKKQKT